MAARDTTATERSSEEIRREIERTRSQMDEAVEAIGDKLSPGRFVDELWMRAQTEGAAAFTNTMRDHPIPFALVGLGLGWLVMEQARGRNGGAGDGAGPGTYERAEGRVGPYRGDAVDRDDPEWEYSGMGVKMKARVSEAAHAVEERLSHAAASVRETAADVEHRVADLGHELQDRAHAAEERIASRAHRTADAARQRAHQGAEKARDGFWTLLEQNPMALGAIAFGLGVAAGTAPPSTLWEDERLGRVAGPLKEEAMRAMQDTAEKVKDVARDAAQAARSELERQRDELADPFQQVVDRMKATARDVGRVAAEAARERAREEGLTTEGIKNVAQRMRDRTRETTGS